MDVRRPLKVAFVDFDGTLADLVIEYDEVRRQARQLLERDGLATTGGLYSMIAMTRRRRPALLPKLLRLITKYERLGARKSRLKPGARTLIRWLARSGVAVFVVTVNHATAVRYALRKHGILAYVSGISGRVDTERGMRLLKPNASTLLQQLKKRHAQKAQAIMIGDAVNDIEVARRARISAYIISSPPSRYAYTSIRSLTRLPKLLQHDFAIYQRLHG